MGIFSNTTIISRIAIGNILQLVNLIDDISPSLDHYDDHHLTEKIRATDQENYKHSQKMGTFMYLLTSTNKSVVAIDIL